LLAKNEKVATVEQYPVRRSEPLPHPSRRVCGGLQVAAPHELGPKGAGQRNSSAGPEDHALHRPKSMCWDRQSINVVGERLIGSELSIVPAGGHHEGSGGKTLGQFSHPSGDATPHGRKVEGQKQLNDSSPI
jgi:hypothetical protein